MTEFCLFHDTTPPQSPTTHFLTICTQKSVQTQADNMQQHLFGHEDHAPSRTQGSAWQGASAAVALLYSPPAAVAPPTHQSPPSYDSAPARAFPPKMLLDELDSQLFAREQKNKIWTEIQVCAPFTPRNMLDGCFSAALRAAPCIAK